MLTWEPNAGILMPSEICLKNLAAGAAMLESCFLHIVSLVPTIALNHCKSWSAIVVLVEAQ